MKGLHYLSEEIRDRGIKKDYLTVVKGLITKSAVYKAWFKKDEKTNRVAIFDKKEPGTEEIITSITPLNSTADYTMVRVGLLTGKTHQIRAHLSFLGYPIVGDKKYGNEEINTIFRKKFHLTHQLLHSWKLTFPENAYPDLSEQTYTAPIPKEALVILKSIGLGDPDEKK